jgi:hypothetical protein
LAQYKAEYELEQEAKISDSQNDMPMFVDFASEWLATKKNKIELCTWESYEIYLTRHILPYFKKAESQAQRGLAKARQGLLRVQIQQGEA